jgi:glycosyltransferase involved in cell wall biosynthesis
MQNNYDLIETNETNKNSSGGTELMQRKIYDGTIPRELLERTQIVFSRARELDPERKKIFYAHDLPEDPESSRLSDPMFRKKFDKFVFVSNWQMEKYNEVRGVTYAQSTVIKNAIEPFEVSQRTKSDKIRFIYHTTPHRGLELLVPVFVKLAEQHKDITLDVYSSFNLYGENWAARDEAYKPIFDMCKEHPQINYHGAVSNEEVRTALLNSDIYAYPSIWKETSCLSLIEAMSAGLLCVHPNYGALTETSMGLTWMYQWNEDKNQHANGLYQILQQAIVVMRDQREAVDGDLRLQKIQVDRIHSWVNKAPEWIALLQSLTVDK